MDLTVCAAALVNGLKPPHLLLYQSTVKTGKGPAFIWIRDIVLVQVDGLITPHFPFYRFRVMTDAVLHLYIHVSMRHVLLLWMENGRVPQAQ